MKAIIHIGMPKTGSTSIQAWLKSNHDMLEKSGVHTLQEISHVRPFLDATFHMAVREMKVEKRAARWWPDKAFNEKNMRRIERNCKFLNSKFMKISGKSGLFAYSREGLYKLREIQIVALDNLLSKFFDEICYIVYIRDMVDHFVSEFSERLRRNSPDSSTMIFSSLIEKCANDAVPYGTEISLEHLFEWNEIVGNRLKVRLLESDWLFKGDLIEDFASQLGVDAICKPVRMRASFAIEYIEYVRFLNCEFGKSLPKEIRKTAMGILTSASIGKPKPSMSDAQAMRIYEINREIAERIRKSFFPDRPFLFSPKFRGGCVMPLPLTDRRKEEIETLIHENMMPTGWDPYDLARCG